ncbi:AcrR family transcriptional regulator [Caldalkalibacillus uzonensis]|uniref:AcrR family transcriptional regulator n=1 Tax=Caldalkalibacillus uzonensis TaxID=353224 RepID=A0ABU0CVT5_9BACI|nr:TetR/AcrR family transcriptional regulator [Caldalkalibacillus uzonensis]MDQ0340537.1 AcrR family transcriptional regulator [Caldalkalibacillus uzonensis]
MGKEKLTQRQLKALQTKKDLFESAITLFRQKGYDEVSIDDIAERAGTAKGTFYTYFKSKDQVIIEQFNKIDEQYLQVFKSFNNQQSATEKLMRFVKEQHLYCSHVIGIDLLKIVYYSQIRNKGEAVEVIDENRWLYRLVRNIIEEGQASGEFRTDLSSEELTRMVVRCMRGTLYDYCLYNGQFDLVEDGQKFFELFINGVLKQ